MKGRNISCVKLLAGTINKFVKSFEIVFTDHLINVLRHILNVCDEILTLQEKEEEEANKKKKKNKKKHDILSNY